MRIVGFVKDSLVDYPGKHCATIYTPTCNFRCPWCFNTDVVKETTNQSFALWDLEQLDKKWIEAVCISGGEPTLWETLPNVCRTLKSMGFKVKLDTNGTNPDMLLELGNFELVDYVAMDYKIPYSKEVVGRELTLTELMNIFSSIDLLLDLKLFDYELRTTLIPGIHTPELFEDWCSNIKDAKRFYIQNFWKNCKHLDSKYNNVVPFTAEEIESFKKVAEKYIKNVGVRNLV
jgi:pyruvate formate lyase activating enzyme